MEIKNLFTKFKQKEEIPEQFFAIEISDDIVKTAVWTVVDGHTKIVKIGSFESWNDQDKDSLLKTIDQSVSNASENLDPEPSGAVFGLPESWLDKDSINPDKKKLLKKLCEDLELKPLGFVVTDNAIIKYLKIEEGTPPSAIFLQISSGELNLSLVKLGKTIGNELIGRSEDLGADVEEGLSRFDKIDTLPSRMILYNGKGGNDFEEDKQQLTSYDWEEKLPFIHFPKVEALPPDASIKAVALAGGSEVAKSLGFEIKPPEKKSVEPEPESQMEATSSEIGSKEKIDQPTTAINLGFSSKDIAEDIKSETHLEPDLSPDQPVTAEPEVDFNNDQEKISQSVTVGQPISPLSSTFSNLLQSIKVLPIKAINKLKSLQKLKKAPKTLTLIAIGFGILVIGVFSAYWYLPKAQVTIFVESKTIDEELELTIDPEASVLDLEAGIVPGNSVEISVEGSSSVSTTGTNLIGDPAQGDIMIYNYTDKPKTFSQNTVLIGPDNLAFTLDEEVTATSSGDTYIDSNGQKITPPGKVTAKIIAKSIGPESNLSKDTQLSFQQFSEDNYLAKVIDGLSGGTSREVKAVSEEDQNNLLLALTAELKDKAAAELKDQIGEDKTLVDVEDQDELISKSFNYDVGEEANNLNLDAKLEYQALSFNQKDLNLLLQQTIKEKIPDNFQLSQNSEIEIEPAKLNKDGTAVVIVIFKAKLIPKLDFTDIKKNIKGRFPHIIEEYLATLPNFIKADIIITPNLPAKLKTLPRITKNITLEIKAED